MAKQTGEMVEFKSKFTPEERKVQDVSTYVREFVESAVGIVRNPDPGIIELHDVRIDYMTGDRGGFYNPWSSTTVKGIILKTNDADYRYTVRKVMVKDGKIDKTDLVKKYNELTEFAKTVKLEREAKEKHSALLSRFRNSMLMDAGYVVGQYGNLAGEHGLMDFKCTDYDKVEMEITVSPEKAKQILQLLKG